jgi:hypothetical protein
MRLNVATPDELVVAVMVYARLLASTNRTVTLAPATAKPPDWIVTLDDTLSHDDRASVMLLTDIVATAGALTLIVVEALLLVALLSLLRLLVALKACVPVAVDVVVIQEKVTLPVCPAASVTAFDWLNPFGVSCNTTGIDAFAEPLFVTVTLTATASPRMTVAGIVTAATCASIVTCGSGVGVGAGGVGSGDGVGSGVVGSGVVGSGVGIGTGIVLLPARCPKSSAPLLS